MIDPSAGTPVQARARSFVRHVIIPTVAAAAETYPELSIADILPLCEPALVRDLTFELESACRQAIRPESAGGRTARNVGGNNDPGRMVEFRPRPAALKGRVSGNKVSPNVGGDARIER